MIYEPNTILAKFVYDPSAPAGAVPSGGVDVPVNSDFADTCADDGFVHADAVMVKASPNEVIIQRAEPPYLRFTFTHPMICKAFRSVSTAG